MNIKKPILVLLVLVLLFSFSGCKDKKTSKNTSSVFNNDDFPSFVVENTVASPGEDVVVYVKLKDNPGFLTMAMNIEFDSKSLILNEVKNGEDYKEYNFIGPKNRGSGCSASWFIADLPQKNIDGTLLELHFKVTDNAKSGDYSVKISRPDNGGIVDGNKEPVIINNAVGYITVK